MYNKLKEIFDLVGVIDVNRYEGYKEIEEFKNKKTIFVVCLAYPSIVFKHEKDKYLGSLYTYGLDYHLLMRELAKEVTNKDNMTILVDNHNIDERKCLELTGLAYKGKNDLMINKDYGSFFFIGLILTEEKYPEVIINNNDSCGECTICIKACPVNALDNGFNIKKCLSALNQLKKPLSEKTRKKNYLLLGCDICQLVCPKNKNIKKIKHSHTKQLITKHINIDDMFDLSNKKFNKKYGHHAYLWRGKTLLLRNALTLLLKYKNTEYNNKIEKTINNYNYPDWFRSDAKVILKELKQIKSKQKLCKLTHNLK